MHVISGELDQTSEGLLMAKDPAPPESKRARVDDATADGLLQQPLRVGERIRPNGREGITFEVIFTDSSSQPQYAVLRALNTDELHYASLWKHRGELCWVEKPVPERTLRSPLFS